MIKMSLNAFLLLIIFFYQTHGMEQPLQKSSMQHHSSASLQGLPADLKRYIIPFVVRGTLKDMTRGLYNLATIDTWFHSYLNNSKNMITILNNLPYIANRISIVTKLKDKKKSLPVMSSEMIFLNNFLKAPPTGGQQLIDAAITGDMQTLAKLLRAPNINLHYLPSLGYTALHWAAYNGHSLAVQLLLSAGADPDFRSLRDETPLMLVARRHGVADIIPLLLSAGADANIQDPLNRTALLFAVQNGNLEACKILLAAGATMAEGDVGYSRTWARTIAKQKGYDEIVALLDRDSALKKIPYEKTLPTINSLWDCTII